MPLATPGVVAGATATGRAWRAKSPRLCANEPVHQGLAKGRAAKGSLPTITLRGRVAKGSGGLSSEVAALRAWGRTAYLTVAIVCMFNSFNSLRALFNHLAMYSLQIYVISLCHYK